MTPQHMTAERFEALAEAYGGDVARWPLAGCTLRPLLFVSE